MKIITALFFSLFLAKGCSDIKDSTIKYELSTRGAYKLATITKDAFMVQHNRDTKPQKVELTASEWKELTSLFSKVDLKNLANLKGETNKHTFDGAMFADLTVENGGEVYHTQGFDRGTPPKEISALINFIEGKMETSKPSLDGEFKVVEVNGENVESGKLTALIANDKISGYTGCNTYGGSFETNENQVKFSYMRVTKRYCEDMSKTENALLSAISKTTQLVLIQGELHFLDENETILIKAQK